VSGAAEIARRAVGGSLLAALFVGATLFPTTPSGAQSGTMQKILYGEVVSAEEAVVVGEPRGTGAQVGATVGAVAGYALADRGDRWLGALLGGVVGGAAGHSAEKKAKKKKGWTLIVKLDDGEEVGVQVPSRKERFMAGDRVRLMTGGGRTDVTRVAK